VSGVAVLSAIRSPYGSLLGSLSALPPASLGGLVAAEAIRRSGVSVQEIGRAVLGNTTAYGVKGNPAAAACHAAGLAPGGLCVTIRAGCASGLLAAVLAAEWIDAGTCDVVLAGGFESASMAPHLAAGLRRGLRLGPGTLLDAARHDGPAPFPIGGDVLAGALGSAAGTSDFAEEIAPISIRSRKGTEPAIVERDDAFARPAGDEIGAATDAPSPAPLADGAAALILASPSWAAANGFTPLGHLSVAPRPIPSAMERARFIEADVTEAAARDIAAALPPSRLGIVNLCGGGRIGHAAGADGARLVVTLLHALRRSGGGRGLAVASGAWGESAGAVVEA
jgi:acetyl-CoA C-acetyltransferase